MKNRILLCFWFANRVDTDPPDMIKWLPDVEDAKEHLGIWQKSFSASEHCKYAIYSVTREGVETLS